MFNLKKFQNWMDNKEIIKYSRDILEGYNLPKDIVGILAEIGLPRKADPFLWFLSMENGAFKRLNKFYDLVNEDCIEKFRKEEYLEKFIVFGISSGHAICFNEKYQIVCVDSKDFSVFFVNDTLEQLLEFILCFDKMVNKIKKRYNEEIIYSDYVTSEDIRELKENICGIINDSLDQYDFWDESIEFLEEQIEFH